MAATPRMAIAANGEPAAGSPTSRWHSYPGRPDQAGPVRVLLAGLLDGPAGAGCASSAPWLRRGA
jgi:hypothetical protein